jgi:hypothetical protein
MNKLSKFISESHFFLYCFCDTLPTLATTFPDNIYYEIEK